jgi:hypothetical protein
VGFDSVGSACHGFVRGGEWCRIGSGGPWAGQASRSKRAR